MSYENAPSTRLIATSCACCGRPLRDADSVEAGVGPDCRKRYGYDLAQGPADFAAACAALELAGDDPDLTRLLDRDDAHSSANRLAHAFAVHGDGRRHAAIASACVALGYAQLGAKLSDVAAEVRVEQVDGGFAVMAPYVEGAGSRWYRAGGRWDKAGKVWRFGQASRRALWSLLGELYPGRVAAGPRGLFIIPTF